MFSSPLALQLQDLPEHIRSLFLGYYDYGWFNFLQGLQFSSLTDLQSHHFQSIGSRRSADRWHSRLITDLWSIIENLFNDRRSALQTISDRVAEDHPAAAPAYKAAKLELSFGRRDISDFYHQYFHTTSSSLEGRSVDELRKWLKVVRTAREAFGGQCLPPDDFSPGGKHRDWLML